MIRRDECIIYWYCTFSYIALVLHYKGGYGYTRISHSLNVPNQKETAAFFNHKVIYTCTNSHQLKSKVV